MLKNWTVTTKQIKKSESGFINHINYLSDNNRSSHANTNIVVLNNASKNILEEIENRKKYRRENSLRGGGVVNYSTSFCLILPRDIRQPKAEEWSEIADQVIKKLSKTNNVDFEKLKSLTHLVIHDERSGEKSSHLNMTVSNVYEEKALKSMTQYKSTHAVKMAFNDAVRDVLQVDNYDYQPKKTGAESVPLWLARDQKAKDTEDRASEAEERALKAELIVDTAKAAYNTLRQRASVLTASLKSWINKIKNKEKAHTEAKKVAENLDEIEWETPKIFEKEAIEIVVESTEMINEIEESNALEEINKVSNKRTKKQSVERKRRKRTRTTKE
jgi:hypothetical protein